MAKFCSKCGATLEEGARFCVMCGAKAEENVAAEAAFNANTVEASAETATFGEAQTDLPKEDVINIPYINKQIKKADAIKYGKLAGIVAGVVLVAVLMVSILFPGPKSVVKKFAKAMEKGDAEAVVELMPDFYFVEDYNDFDDAVDELEEVFDDVDVTIEIKKIEDLTSKEIKECKTMLAFVELFNKDFDVDDIKEYKKATLKMTDDDGDKETVKLLLVKYEGKWSIIPDML